MTHPLQTEAILRAAGRRGWIDRSIVPTLATSLASCTTTELGQALRAAGAGGVADRLGDLMPPTGHPGFGRWQALARLGGGAMGVVWLAAAAEGPLVVVKTALHPGRSLMLSGDSGGSVWTGDAAEGERPSPEAELHGRFAREARITASLTHPRIVPCLDGGIAADGTRYLVLAWVPEGDLAEELARGGPLRPAVALAVVDQIADALELAHGRGVIHRDLKPANIFVCADGSVLLGDFGLARATSAGATRMTMAGVAVGTPNAMAPEQIDGRDAVDGRADLYALGCLMYVCLTGRPPYAGRRAEVMQAHRTAPPPDLDDAIPGLPAGVAQLVSRLMQKRPEDRPDSAISVRTMLAPLLATYGLMPGETIRLREVPPAACVSSDDALLLHGPDGDPTIVLWGRDRLVLGKHRTVGVDLVVRDYPEDAHRERITRVSRRHAEIHCHSTGETTVTDLASSNGTTLNGIRLRQGVPHSVSAASELVLGEVAAMRLRPCPGAAVIERPTNRPNLFYALVPLSLSIGQDGDLPIAGATSRVQLQRTDNSWRCDDRALPDVLELGGIRLRICRLGDFL